MRIVITGGPRTGKTTLADQLSPSARHTDELTPLGWSESSAAAAEWLAEPGPWLIEGVTAVRALRKRLAADPGKPADRVVLLTVARVPLSDGQSRMARGVATIWSEIEPELVARGVEIAVDPDPETVALWIQSDCADDTRSASCGDR